MYSDGVMSVSVNEFSTKAFKVPETFLDCTGKKRNV